MCTYFWRFLPKCIYLGNMSIKMAKNVKEERLRWILPIIKGETKLVEIAKVCPHSIRSLERWLASYKRYRKKGLIPKSTRPKTHPEETPIRIKERVFIIPPRNWTTC